MKIRDFIEKVESLYMGCSMETRVDCDLCETIPQWIGTASYTFKNADGSDRILKQLSPNSYYSDTVMYNVMCCFDLMGDNFGDYHHWLSNMMTYLEKSLDSHEMTEDDELYIMLGQHIDDCLYEISDITYMSDRLGSYIVISAKTLPIESAAMNIQSKERRHEQ